MTPYKLPLIAAPQTFTLTMGGVQYQMTVRWCPPNNSWMLDISDFSNNPILTGIPIVTGSDLLEQFGYLKFGGKLIAQTDTDTLAVPNFNNLGSSGNLFFVVE